MANTITTSAQAEPEYPTEPQDARGLPTLWRRIALGAILLISVFMNFFKLGQSGFTSYYPPAVRSMMDNWHNFFFAAYDPGGFSSLDKPPVGFWLQVLSAKIFGLTPVSVLLPQAVCGVLAVLLLYALVRRQFGVTAGLLAALALALSPISVIANRTVQVDSTLALVLLMGAWAILRAASTGRLRWLLLCAAIIGVGFNIKMLEAYLVLPAFGLLYLLAAPRSIWKRLWHLALALLLLLVISLSWVLIVDLTPATQRPHVGSTTDDSEINLALGYNGIQRLLGTRGEGTPEQQPSGTQPSSINGNPGQGPVNGNPGPTPGNMGSTLVESFLPHLLTEPLAGQSGWLLPLALFGMIALLKFRRPRPQSDRTLQALILWGMWLLTMGIFFSAAQFTHEYYLTVMAPAIAALCGIGLATMWQDYRRSGWRAWLLPLAIIATASEQVSILSDFPDWGRWMIPLLIVLCLLAVGALICARLSLRFTSKAPWPRLLLPALTLGLVALMLGPTVWAAIPIFQGTEGGEPVAGPPGQSPGAAAKIDPALIRYLEANQGNAQILVATDQMGMADDIILATNKTVMPLGGFSYYPLTTTELASLIAQGKLRFLLIGQPLPVASTHTPDSGFHPQQVNVGSSPAGQLNGASSPAGQLNGASAPAGLNDVIAWTTRHCKVVPSSQWQIFSTSASGGNGSGSNTAQLYDCAAAH